MVAQNEQSQPWRMVAFAVSFYMVTSIVMVLVNKWTLNGIVVPLTFLWAQLFIAVVLLHFCSCFGLMKLPTIQRDVAYRLMPLIGINVIGLTVNTLCLQYVDASFYQVARALVLPFTVCFSYLFLNKSSSLLILLMCFIVCLGFFVGVSSETYSTITNTSSIGIFYGVFSSVTTALHAIVIKKSLDIVQGATMDLVYYNNLLSAVALLPILIISGEHVSVYEMMWDSLDETGTGGVYDGTTGDGSPNAALRTFIIGALVTGFFGFLINIAGFLQIKVTSPVTHMISSAVRGVLQTFLAVIWFNDILTTGRVAGIFLILAGSTGYTWVKELETRHDNAYLAKQSRGEYTVVQAEGEENENIAVESMEMADKGGEVGRDR